jgi:hypothetical protein
MKHLFVWKDLTGYLAVAHADSVAEARAMLISDEPECIGESGDGSCPERDEAREHVRSSNPFIYHGSHAEFALRDSAECREQEHYSSRLHKALEESLKLQAHYAELLNMLPDVPGVQHRLFTQQL